MNDTDKLVGELEQSLHIASCLRTALAESTAIFVRMQTYPKMVERHHEVLKAAHEFLDKKSPFKTWPPTTLADAPRKTDD